jgi:hypothetical protein
LIIWYPFTEYSMRDGLMRYDAGNTERLMWCADIPMCAP